MSRMQAETWMPEKAKRVHSDRKIYWWMQEVSKQYCLVSALVSPPHMLVPCESLNFYWKEFVEYILHCIVSIIVVYNGMQQNNTLFC